MMLGILLAFLPLFAAADDSPSASPAVSVRAARHGGKLGKKFGQAKKGPNTLSAIHGHCTLLESPMNPLNGPCISVPLELRDEKGVSLSQVRTTVRGEFNFIAESSGPFKIVPSSSYYLVVAPLGGVKQGEAVELKIREKN